MWEKNKEKYAEALDLCDEFDLKGKTMPYTSSNTYMFSSLNKAGELGIRLSKADAEEYQKKYSNEPYISYGAKIKEHVLRCVGREGEKLKSLRYLETLIKLG